MIPIEFYGDASSHRDHEFSVVGGVAIRKNRLDDINTQIQSIKDNAGISGELKWSSYRGGAKRDAYKSVVDTFFDLIDRKHMAFHCIIAHFSEFTHKWREEPGSPERSVNRLYYQLSLHRVCRYYGKSCAIYIYPDHGNDSKEFITFREPLCADAFLRYSTKPNSVRSIMPLDSQHHSVLQAVDVIVGGIAASRNGRISAQHKVELAKHILAKSGRPDWSTDTPMSARFLTVWNFQHRTRPHPPRRHGRHG